MTSGMGASTRRNEYVGIESGRGTASGSGLLTYRPVDGVGQDFRGRTLSARHSGHAFDGGGNLSRDSSVAPGQAQIAWR